MDAVTIVEWRIHAKMIVSYCADALSTGQKRKFIESAYHTDDLNLWARDLVLDQLKAMRALQAGKPIPAELAGLAEEVKDALKVAGLLK